MSLTLSAPGVYVQEIPSGARTITGVSTSLTAFVGRARRGPIDQPTRVSSWSEFDRTFGGLWSASTMSHTVRHYFQNGGSEALIVRVTNDEWLILTATAEAEAVPGYDHIEVTVTPTGATTFDLQIDAVDAGGAVIDDGDPYTATVTLDTAAPDPAAIDGAQTAHGVPVALVTATGDFPTEVPPAGSTSGTAALPSVVLIGNGAATSTTVVPIGLRLVATPQAEAIDGFDHLVASVANSDSVAGTFDLTIAAADVGGTTINDGDPYSVTIAIDVATAYAADIDAAVTAHGTSLATVVGTPPALVAPNGTVAATTPVTELVVASRRLRLDAADPGAWGNNLRAEVTYDDVTGDDFHLRISEVTPDGAVLADEQYYNLSTDPLGQQWVERVLEQRSALARLVTAATPASADAGPPVATFAGGLDGAAPRITDDIQGSQLDRTGMYALLEADLFNLLCIPLDSWSTTDAGHVAMWGAAAELCRDERAFLLIDPPSDWASFAAAEAGAATLTLRDRNAAMYFPRIVAPNPLNQNRPSDFPPCGAVAGAIARTDGDRGVWKAPAGIEVNLFGVPQLSMKLTDPQHGVLNQLGINCLRAFPVYGRVLWGARTLDGADVLASEWKYVPVRRLALYLEESLWRGTQWAVFEPNDEPLWAQLRLSVGAFMGQLFRQGAFQGSSASEAYFVKCDAETTPQGDVDRGVVNVIIGFAPLKPAEFVIVKLQQISARAGS